MAYGTNAPFGFQPRFMLTSATFNGQTTTNLIANAYATSIFTGDPILYAATGSIIVAPVINPVGTPVLGVFNQVKFRATDGTYITAPYWPANTNTFQNEGAIASVITDSNVVYAVQISTSANVAVNTVTLTQAMIGNNANFNVGPNLFAPPAGTANNPATGSTISGQSAYYLDVSTVDITSTLPLKIIGIEPNPQNAFGQPFNVALVVFNTNVLQSVGTPGI